MTTQVYTEEEDQNKTKVRSDVFTLHWLFSICQRLKNSHASRHMFPHGSHLGSGDAASVRCWEDLPPWQLSPEIHTSCRTRDPLGLAQFHSMLQWGQEELWAFCSILCHYCWPEWDISVSTSTWSALRWHGDYGEVYWIDVIHLRIPGGSQPLYENEIHSALLITHLLVPLWLQ